MGIVSWLVVGAIAGWLAGLVVDGDERLGVLGHLVLGVVGALVGGFVTAAVLGVDVVNGINLASIVVATVGAVVVVVAWNALVGRTAGGPVV